MFGVPSLTTFLKKCHLFCKVCDIFYSLSNFYNVAIVMIGLPSFVLEQVEKNYGRAEAEKMAYGYRKKRYNGYGYGYKKKRYGYRRW